MIEEESEKIRAAIALSPVLRVRHTLNDLTGQNCDPWALATELKEQLKAVNNGDLTNAENMLFAQAHILDQLFHNLIGHAIAPESALHMEAALKLALKCQTQSRAKLETLSAVKNPPVVYARQANFANGPQQINNNGPAHGEQKPHNELLEQIHGERLDTGETIETGGSNTPLEALGEGYRPKNEGR